MMENIPSGIRNALIAMAVIEIFLALGAISVCIVSLVITMNSYSMCYQYYYYDHDNRPYVCYGLNSAEYIFSLTSQGLWAGTFIILSACSKIRFAVAPSKSTEQYSTGFSILAFIMAIALTSLEGIGAFAYSYNYNWELWKLHVTNFSLGCTLVIFTLTTMILSSVAIRGCCKARQNRTVPLDARQIPMTYGNPRAYIGQTYVGHATSTAGLPPPSVAMQHHQAMGNNFQNVGATTALGQNIAYNTTSQAMSNQLPTIDYPRENALTKPPIQQSQIYPHLWTTGGQQSDVNADAMQPISTATPIHAYQGQGRPPGAQTDNKNLILTSGQPQPVHDGEYAASGHYQVQAPTAQEQQAADGHQASQ